MKEENVLEVKNLKKKFKVFYDKGTGLKERLLFRQRNHYEDRWVLKGIDFTVKKGEAIGLIGKNGCGKSTTLKLLTRIMYPTEGSIEVKGRVSSLLELGAGFHPDMSGRENIFTNAAIFGLTKKEIKRRLHDIITFSELEEFIDNPVRTYSSGMYMRLAFSVAINVDADILLIDEILAVGDVSFQTKCFEKLKDIKSAGTTIVIVSHAMGQIEQICDRTIWIDDGLIKEEGVPKFVDEHYLAAMEEKRMDKIEENFQKEDRRDELNSSNSMSEFCSKRAVRVGNKKVEIVNCKLLNDKKENKKVFNNGAELRVRIEMRSNEVRSVNVGVSISRDDGLYCCGNSLYAETDNLITIENCQILEFIITNIILLSGKYFINLGVYSKTNEEYDVIWNAIDFLVTSENTGEEGLFKIEHIWEYGRRN